MEIDPRKNIEWPRIKKCDVCHGVKSAVVEGKEVGAVEALNIAMLEHGFWMAKWEGKNVSNIKFIPNACVCDCDHDFKTDNSEKTFAFEHRYKCTKCGKVIIQDSSG
jgi:Zn finger protein HypA/HybF involved in hydrogenase expression